MSGWPQRSSVLVGLLAFVGLSIAVVIAPRDEWVAVATGAVGLLVIGYLVLAVVHAERLARRSAGDRALLLRVSRVATSSLALPSVLIEIARTGLAIPGAECCGIELWHPETDELEVVAEETVPEWPGVAPVGTRYALSTWDGDQNVVFQRQSRISRLTDANLSDQERRDMEREGIKTLLRAPLLVGPACIGIFILYSRRLNGFDAGARRLAEDVAAQTALVIANSRLLDALAEQARTDGLTDLLNHRAIVAALDEALAGTRLAGTPVALLMIDLDNFKRANDTHGHLTGDGILRYAARMMRDCLRDRGRLGRYGGDEFLIVLPGDDGPDAIEIAGEILAYAAARSAPLADGSGAFPLRLSIGVAAAPDDGLTSHDLVAVADRAMYAAKAAGGGIAVARPQPLS